MSGSDGKVAEVYAEALVAIAEKNNVRSFIHDDLLLLKTIFLAAPELLMRLDMPSLDAKRRYALIDKVLDGKVHSVTMRLLALIIRRGRLCMITELYDAFNDVYDRRAQVIDVKVTTARSVDIQLISEFETIIKKRFGENSRITYATDPALIAGYCISTAESEVDCSVRSGIHQLRKQLLHN